MPLRRAAGKGVRFNAGEISPIQLKFPSPWVWTSAAGGKWPGPAQLGSPVAFAHRRFLPVPPNIFLECRK